MTATIWLRDDAARERAAKACKYAPAGSIVTLKPPTRSLDQNSKLWAMLTDIARQVDHAGGKLSPPDWKTVFMHELGHENRVVPALDGRGFVPLGYSTSKLSVSDMADLLTLIQAFGDGQGVRWGE
jgi:hypothetical protein